MHDRSSFRPLETYVELIRHQLITALGSSRVSQLLCNEAVFSLQRQSSIFIYQSRLANTARLRAKPLGISAF